MANSPFQNPYESQYPVRKRQWEDNHHNTAESKKATPVTLYSLFPNFDRLSIGFEDMLKTLQHTTALKNPTYPPYNITKFEGGNWTIELALAGFRKEDIEIKVEDRTLTVSSTHEDDENPKFGEVVHHGIAQRNFTTTFAMAEYVEVAEAIMEDGILSILLVTNIPDEKKPKFIDIN